MRTITRRFPAQVCYFCSQGSGAIATSRALRAGLFLLTAQIIGDALMTMAFVNDVSLRQLLVPDRLLGRVSATANVLGVVAMPLGALAGGIIGQLASPRAVLAAGALGFSLATLWVAAAPIRTPAEWNDEADSRGAAMVREPVD